MIRDDLFLSSSESDPYATDEESSYKTENQDSDDSDDKISNKQIKKRKRKVVKKREMKENNGTEKKISRKRLRNETEWKRNKIRTLRNSGKEYLNWSGKVQPARKMKDSCPNSCKRKCKQKINEEQREEIFNEYWAMADINRQRDFVARHVEVRNKGRSTTRNIDGSENDSDNSIMENLSRRTYSNYYFFTINLTKIAVCKTFFLNTLAISAQVVKTVIKKKGVHGTVNKDLRGMVCKNSQIEEDVKQNIRDHINSFDFIESHYCRINTSRSYLPPTLNISKMYSLYEEHCKDNLIEKPATESMYRKIFSEEFNISFFKPKKDLCDLCHAYENSTTEEKEKLEKEYSLHRENRTKARKAKDEDKERALTDQHFIAATFDLQKALPVPKSDVGLAYYKLKLQTYNFSIFNLGTNDGTCYMWHEGLARRGCSEVGSCLIIFIEDHLKKGIKEFSFYSDNCSGQNRNKFLFSLYNYLAQKHQITIRHTFLERGHTQMEGDSMHSVIEKAAKHVPIYIPQQWYTLVRTAKRRQPYTVVEISQDDIVDLKHLLQSTSINWEKDDEGEKVYLNKIRIVQTNYQFPHIIFFKSSFDQAKFTEINLTQKGRKKKEVSWYAIELKKCYSTKLPIPKKKYDHLQFLCNKNVILPQYHDFFKNLPYTLKTVTNSDSE